MSHFSPTENKHVSDGTPAALDTKTSAKPFFWPYTNTWVTGTVTQVAKSAPADGKPYFCVRLNQWTAGGC